jgi:hypothetical protein
MRTIIRDLIRGRRRVAADSSHDNSLRHLESQTPPSRSEARRWPSRVMKVLTSAIVGLLALFGTSLTPAAAQVWAPPPAWGPGWHHWTGHHRWAPGWRGPVWIAEPGPRHGWYRWHGRWYRHCGWRWEAPSPRVALLLTRWPDPRQSGQHRPRGDGPRPCPANCASG